MSGSKSGIFFYFYSMQRKTLYFLFSLFIVFSSCTRDSSRELDFDVSKIDIPNFTIDRYEEALFSIDTLNFLNELRKIQHKYSVFLGTATLNIENTKPLYKYVTNPSLLDLNKKTKQNYTDISFLRNEIKKAFQYYLHYFPNKKAPLVYTYISGLHFESPVQLSSEAMVIGLDLYLDSDFREYKTHGIPAYKSARMTKEHIAIDCMKEFARIHLYENNMHKNFLDEIIENAKTLYFLDAMLPKKEDHLKIGFTENQLNWCVQNEQNIWAFFIDKQILYSADYEIFRKFTQDGPFTLSFSKEAPAGIGNWIGWQIIRSYMNNNPAVSLKDLLLEIDAQKILKKSAYKPKQK